MIDTIENIKVAMNQVADYFDGEVSGARTVALWDGLNVKLSTVALKDDSGVMSIRVWVCLDGWVPGQSVYDEDVEFGGSRNIPVNENGFINSEAVLAEIAKVVDSIPTDYHHYMD